MEDVKQLVSLTEQATSSTPPEYILLTPGSFPPRTASLYSDNPYGYGYIASYEDIWPVLEQLQYSEIVAVDFETMGGDYSYPELRIVGLGLAWDTGNCYFPFSDLSSENQSLLLEQLSKHEGLIAHNIYFDGGVWLSKTDKHPSWHMCTYAALAHLANEGVPGRFWGLKQAQVELLGWADSNEGELDEWLVLNGFYKGQRRLDSSYEYLLEQYRTGGLKPDKGQMWRAPVDILGKYCILDAESTYLLYTQILRPVLDQFPALTEYLTGNMLLLIRQLIEQKMYGIHMDRAGLLIRKEELVLEIQEIERKFRTHPYIEPHIIAMEVEMVAQGIVCKEPQMHNKDGSVSKNWTKWQQKLSDATDGKLPEYQFNLNSGPQKAELLYTRMGNEVLVRTEKGLPSTGIKGLKRLGEPGKLLTEQAWALKEASYVDKYLELTIDRPTIHPSFRTPGTVTGRLSSKEPNLQQVPKTKAMMSLFRAREGHVWVDLDFSALEPVVLTEFTQDKNLMLIYGNGRPQNDIYLYVGANIPGMKDTIRATGYVPENPTKESLAKAKKEAKHERSICKTVVLACQYGAGVNKVMQTLEQDEIYLDYEEVETIHSGYWDLFQDVRLFSKNLFREWKRNGGYILNGMGRPMAVSKDMTQDLLNRFVQSTGHDILARYISILCTNLDRSGILWRPAIIDFHDATTVEVPAGDSDRTVQIFLDSLAQLNRELQGTIELKGIPTVGIDLSQVKEPGE